MSVNDLREWLARVEEIGDLTRVDGADPELEIGGITDLYQWEMGNPALLFDNIKGYEPGFRIASNVFTSLRRVAISLGLPIEYGPREFVQAWRTQLKDLEPRPAVVVGSGPVGENRMEGDDVDLMRFPAPLWHRGDGGRFLGTGNIVVMRDPDTGWVNCGTYRVQLHDAKTVGLYISPGKHGRLIRDKYWKRGEACPVAVSCGHDPLLLLLGGLEVDYGTNEYDVAGAIRGEPVELIEAPYTGLPVPATAEIVLEGEIPPNALRSEGPFGEWTGYYASGEKEEPIIEVHSVIYRDNPIVLGCLPGKPPNDNTFFRSPLRAALIWDELSAPASRGSKESGRTRLGAAAYSTSSLSSRCTLATPSRSALPRQAAIPAHMRTVSWSSSTTTSIRPIRTRCCGRCPRARTLSRTSTL